MPVREVAERAEGLLQLAKSGAKNQCAALDGVFPWEQFGSIVEEGEQIVGWIESRIAPRSLVYRLYRIASEKRWSKAGLWTYQVGRNISKFRREMQGFRRWALITMGRLRPYERPAVASSLLYALMATRP